VQGGDRSHPPENCKTRPKGFGISALANANAQSVPFLHACGTGTRNDPRISEEHRAHWKTTSSDTMHSRAWRLDDGQRFVLRLLVVRRRGRRRGRRGGPRRRRGRRRPRRRSLRRSRATPPRVARTTLLRATGFVRPPLPPLLALVLLAGPDELAVDRGLHAVLVVLCLRQCEMPCETHCEAKRDPRHEVLCGTQQCESQPPGTHVTKGPRNALRIGTATLRHVRLPPAGPATPDKQARF